MSNLTVTQVGSESANRIKNQATRDLQRNYGLSCLTSTLSPLARSKFRSIGQ